jgi:hypothetical protein
MVEGISFHDFCYTAERFGVPWRSDGVESITDVPDVVESALSEAIVTRGLVVVAYL